MPVPLVTLLVPVITLVSLSSTQPCSYVDSPGIAEHFEKSGNNLEAGRFHMKAGEYSKALRLLLKCEDPEGAHIDLAIDAIGTCLSIMQPTVSFALPVLTLR